MFYRCKLFGAQSVKGRIQHISISGQYLNCGLKNAFIKVLRLRIPIYGAMLLSAFNFRDAF